MSTSPNPPISEDSNPQTAENSNLEPPRPASYISSRITDIGSEDGGDEAPRSALSSQPTWSQPPGSRRGPPPARNSLIASSSNASRPPSSASRMSRTHVPSLTSHAFFRPMSSQRLQAQRASRPANTSQPFHSDDQSDEASQQRRSVASNNTIQRPGTQSANDAEVPPPSRGTEFTDPVLPDRNTSNASPTGNTTVRSLGESVRLLHDNSRKPAPSHLNLGKNYKAPSNDQQQKSPLSFRSGFLMPNKNEGQERDSRNHERLSSAASSSPNSYPMKNVQPSPRKDLGKNYEYFTGNTVFCAGGRFQNARDRPVNIATGIFVILPAGLFFGYSAPWLWKNVSPAIPIVFAYIFYICLSSFIHASVVDPGIIPRNLHPMPPADQTEDPLTLGPPTNDWVMIKLATSEVAAMDVPVKYCRTCNIWRPPRCYHCRACDNCIETLDHHCVWLNNCVGRRNYRYFFSFVSSATVLAFFLFAVSLAHCLVYKSRAGISFNETISQLRVPFAMVIYGIIAAPYPASLWAYHFYLMGRGETTREYLNSHKFQKKDRHRPFTQGNFVKNWMAVLGRPRPPTYLRFKSRYEEGDQRLGALRGKKRAKDLEAQEDGMEMQKMEGPDDNQQR